MDESHETCGGKVCFSYREAHTVLNGTKRRQHYSHSKIIPKRAYKCPDCGWYHLTSDSVPAFDKRHAKDYRG